MNGAIVAILIAFFVAAESATIFVDDDGFRPRAIGALGTDVLANNANTDYERRKFIYPGSALAAVYMDSPASQLGAQTPLRFRGFFVGKSPLYQLNAAWRI